MSFDPKRHPRTLINGEFVKAGAIASGKPRTKKPRAPKPPVQDMHQALATILARGASHNTKFAKVAERARIEADIRAGRRKA